MAPDLRIRPYDPADEARCWEIHERASTSVDAFANPDGVEGGVPTTPEAHARESRELAERGVSLVGEVVVDDEGGVDGGDGSRVVAMGALDPLGGVGASEDETAAEVTRMRVDPDHWRQGHGRAMLAALEDEALAAGWTTLVLETLARQTGARHLYESKGYAEVDRVQHGEYDVRRYRKELDTEGSG